MEGSLQRQLSESVVEIRSELRRRKRRSSPQRYEIGGFKTSFEFTSE